MTFVIVYCWSFRTSLFEIAYNKCILAQKCSLWIIETLNMC